MACEAEVSVAVSFARKHRCKLERGVKTRLVHIVDVEVLVLEVQCHQV